MKGSSIYCTTKTIKPKDNGIKPLLIDVLALKRYRPMSSGNYGDGYMVDDNAGDWFSREEVIELVSKYFT